jgi:hypothetical protein
METVNYAGFEFEFDYNYQPEEKQTYDYPGCDESFEIFNVTLNGIDASELLESQIDEFEEEVINMLKGR